MAQGGAAYDMGLETDRAAQETIQSALEGGLMTTRHKHSLLIFVMCLLQLVEHRKPAGNIIHSRRNRCTKFCKRYSWTDSNTL